MLKADWLVSRWSTLLDLSSISSTHCSVALRVKVLLQCPVSSLFGYHVVMLCVDKASSSLTQSVL